MILPLTEIVSLLPLGIGCDGVKRVLGLREGATQARRTF
jgi:hypothetical protein